ncbi:hypothetical protein CCYA_CCYA16G4074 [Cyanidiococcus yangmingshanensis]|nr:hypothetical protein CCYA_CCYA16G4074 [Cyanidiococcus yangmingshanensis]
MLTLSKGGLKVLEIPTRAWLHSLGIGSGGLDQVPDTAFAYLVTFDYVWLQGVWQTGSLGIELDRTSPERRAEYDRILPDWTVEDVVGSPYAIYDYRIAADLGGEEALAGFRRRLAPARLLLDFVPNHMALDCPWPESFFLHERATSAPEEADEVSTRASSVSRVEGPEQRRTSPRRLNGRDPYFGPWPDTAQLNYREEAMQRQLIEVLCRIADMADGVRADMAMMVLHEVFEWIWSGKAAETQSAPPNQDEFWERAIVAVRQRRSDFLFLAEVYWGYETRLQELGFHATYDKKLYDLLHERHLDHLRTYLQQRPAAFHARSVHFVENHDEPRAVHHFGDRLVANAAAALSFLLPGIRLEFWGQAEGRQTRLDVHLRRAASESKVQNEAAQICFYRRLQDVLSLPILRHGIWVYDEEGPRQHWRLITWNWYLDESMHLEDDTPTHLHVVANYSDTAVCYRNGYHRDLLAPEETVLTSLPPWTVRVLCDQSTESGH